ncbi:hypothetical protein [Legionella sp. PC1000]|nr:hypothetical protein [Legionella sp. PC1000]
MHLMYITTQKKTHSALDCSLCVNQEAKMETVNRLQLTLADTTSADLTSLTLFCLGVLNTISQEDEITFQRGLEYLRQSVSNKNKHAAYYLALIHAGRHQDKITLTLRDQEKAIQYYLISFRLDYYEALNDLMLSLRTGTGVISKDKARWHQLFIQLFIEAGQNKDNILISHLIRCLVQQDYVTSNSEHFLFLAAEIINFWMKTPYWNQRYTKLVEGYLQQERTKENQGSLYFFYKLGFSQSQGTYFFNSKVILNEDDIHFIQSIQQLDHEFENRETSAQGERMEQFRTCTIL